MLVAALLSAIQMLTLALGVWGVVERGRALARLALVVAVVLVAAFMARGAWMF